MWQQWSKQFCGLHHTLAAFSQGALVYDIHCKAYMLASLVQHGCHIFHRLQDSACFWQSEVGRTMWRSGCSAS